MLSFASAQGQGRNANASDVEHAAHVVYPPSCLKNSETSRCAVARGVLRWDELNTMFIPMSNAMFIRLHLFSLLNVWCDSYIFRVRKKARARRAYWGRYSKAASSRMQCTTCPFHLSVVRARSMQRAGTGKHRQRPHLNHALPSRWLLRHTKMPQSIPRQYQHVR